MDFPTQFTKVTKDYISESGSPYLQDYEYSLDKEGHKVLVKADTYTDVYSRIQADKDSVDINVLMQRFALGDTEALDIKKGFYLDTRDMPKNIHEVFAMGLEAEQYFEGLPVELKEKFDNSHSVFFTEMSEENNVFMKKINEYNDRFNDHSYDVEKPVEDSNEVNYHE